MAKTYRYKVSGTVKFSVDDIVTASAKKAKEQVSVDVTDDILSAEGKGKLEIIELNAEKLEPCRKNRFYEGMGC